MHKVKFVTDFNIDLVEKFTLKSKILSNVKIIKSQFNNFHYNLKKKELPSNNELKLRYVDNQLSTVSFNFKNELNYSQNNLKSIEEEVNNYCKLISENEKGFDYTILSFFNHKRFKNLSNNLENHHKFGSNIILLKMNIILAEFFSENNKVILVDSCNWIDTDFLSREKNWFYTKSVFDLKNAKKISDNILQIFKNNIEGPKKIIFLDLDNTLWGGIVGEDGMENLKIGGHDPIGEAFQIFQEKLKKLKNNGILLAVVSKNTESVALNCIKNNNEMILKFEDFVKFRINWEDKAFNIKTILKELNLGPESAVFFDDSISERERVKFALPEILTPDLPIDKTLYPIFLENLFCFNTKSLTIEDKKKTELYKENEKRKLKQSSFLKDKGLKAWLKYLNTELEINELNSLDYKRALQLLNKTNQFNLQTKRYNDETLKSYLNKNDNYMFTFRLKDNFGDYGLIGILSFNILKNQIFINNFVLSCRAMSKNVENAMLAFIFEQIDKKGYESITFKYIESKKNKPVLNFLKSVKKNNKSSTFEFKKIDSISYPADIKIYKKYEIKK